MKLLMAINFSKYADLAGEIDTDLAIARQQLDDARIAATRAQTAFEVATKQFEALNTAKRLLEALINR